MIVGVSGDQWRFTGKCRFLIEGLQSLEKKCLLSQSSGTQSGNALQEAIFGHLAYEVYPHILNKTHGKYLACQLIP